MSRSLAPGAYLVLDLAVTEAAGHRPGDVARAAALHGIGTVQVRGKLAAPGAFVDAVVEVARGLAGSGAALVVDDRVDVALAARARGARVDGVHLGQHDLPAGDARALLGRDALIGLSAARPDDVRRALADPAVDYLGVGPVRLTSTKPDATVAVGFDRVREVAADARTAGLPVVAIGGLTARDAGALRAAGAHAVAVVSAVCAHPDPGAAAAALVTAWWQPAPDLAGVVR